MSTKIKSVIFTYFPALSHRNYRYFWTGQCISLIGTWMQNIGQSWLVYTLTKSAFLLGLVNTMQFLPMLLFSLFAGAIIDKLPKRRILIVTQSISMLLALILAVLVWTEWVRYWHVLILATSLGLVNTIDMPTRQSFNVELASKKDLMNAVALNSVIFNAARIVGPALAGFIMAYFGIAFCFFINGLSFIAVIYGLTQIRIEKSAVAEHTTAKKVFEGIMNGKIFKDIKEGLVYIRNSSILLRVLLGMMAVSTFAMNFNVLVPVFAKTILNQGEAGFGMLMSSMGVGSLIGALTLAARSRKGPNQFFLNLGPIFISVLLVILGTTNYYYITAIFLACTGFCMVNFNANNNSTLQINARDEFRGRVSSAFTLVNAGSTPIGALYAGTMASYFGGRAGFIVCGATTLLLYLVIIWFTKKKVESPGAGEVKLSAEQ